MKKEKAKTVSRCAGVILALVVLITIVTTLINMLIPELITSIRNLIFTLPAQINQLVKQMNHIQLDDSTMTTIVEECDERGIYKPSELDAYGSSEQSK